MGDAEAIVILSADYNEHAPEFDQQSIGPLSLERIRYGAWLHRRTGLPILVTGGKQENREHSLAEVMRAALVDEFGVPVRWVESASMSTFEHAHEISRILASQGIRVTLLVTHAWHMRRAVSAFEYFGLKIIPAPTKFTQKPTPILKDFRSGPRRLYYSYLAIYERLAIGWYRLRYFTRRAPDKLPVALNGSQPLPSEAMFKERPEPVPQEGQESYFPIRSTERI